MRNLILAILAVLACTSFAAAAGVPAGYAGTPWGTDLHKVMAKYPKGELGKTEKYVLYRQAAPDREIAQRVFAFDQNRLVMVSVKFDPAFVKKNGVKKLLARQQKVYGAGQADQSKAPHVMSHVWESDKTKIAYSYAPQRPDMTVMLFQMK